MVQWKIFRYKTLAFAWLFFITFLFCFPGSEIPKSPFFAAAYFDKWAHMAVFAVLLFLFCKAYNIQRNYNKRLILFFLVYGVIIELIQLKWIPYRDFDLFDILADLGGILLGILVWWVVRKK